MSVNLKNVNITGGFWKKMQSKNITVTMDAVYSRFKETGRFDALWCNWKEGMENKPHIYWDSDIAKWVEGAAYILSKHPDTELTSKVENVIDAICENQCEDGYYNSYYITIEPENRFKIRDNHELYCAGHLIEAAVAYYEATGKDRFLHAMEKYADYIYKVFLAEKSAGFTTPGHEEIELALLRLYRISKNEKYLELCKFFIENRGKTEEAVNDFAKPAYNQSHMLPRHFKTAEGHAVRAMYLYTAMADLAKETQDAELLCACKSIYKDIVEKKMYITGGTGSSHIGEAFTVNYDLPSERAYSETCSAISLIFFSQKMLENEINSIYADTIERVLYNGMLSGLSLDGKAFFYENPLEITLKNHDRSVSTKTQERLPITQRREIFSCSCCPPNINRILASIEKYIYSLSGDTLYIHQYMQSELKDGDISVIQSTDYPENGKISLKVSGVKKLALRIPYWCSEYEISCGYTVKNGYAYIENPSCVDINFIMKPTLYSSNSEVIDCVGKVALMYGPLVYCAEGIDNNVNLHRLYIKDSLNAELSRSNELDTSVITADAYIIKASDGLYSAFCEEFEDCRIKLIPYRLFANRGESDMLVWLKHRP